VSEATTLAGKAFCIHVDVLLQQHNLILIVVIVVVTIVVKMMMLMYILYLCYVNYIYHYNHVNIYYIIAMRMISVNSKIPWNSLI